MRIFMYMDVNKIFGLFDASGEGSKPDFNHETDMSHLLDNYKEHPMFWVGMFKKLIHNHKTFNHKIMNFFSKIEEEELDLVEMSASKNGEPPVCKILDYGKMMYHHKKKQKSNNHAPRNKEIRYSFNISEHDLEVKHNKVKEFISKQHIVRYVLELKGREKNLVEDAKRKIEDNLKDFEGMAQWPVPVVSHGRKIEISTTIRSK